VKGLNLVLSAWVPYFDPYSASILKVDQWVRISRLPWEFWVEHTLTTLLKPIGEVIRIDHNTLLRKKGRFARVSPMKVCTKFVLFVVAMTIC